MAKDRKMTAESTSDKPRMSLATQILIGLALGVAAGVFFGEMVGWLRFFGDIFIKLLQITVIPYISLALITGIGGLSFKEVKSLAVKGGSVLLFVWGIILLAIMLMPLSFPEWPAATFYTSALVEDAPKIDFLRLFIPSNPFFSYANAIVPAVVVFSILVGIALIGIPNKSKLLEPLSVFREVLMKITGIIAKLSPIGVFALIASAVGTTAFEDLARLQVHFVLYALVALAIGLFVLPGLITVLTPFSYKEIAKALRTPLITAFATGSALIVLPMLIERCKRIMADAKRDAINQDEADASIEVLIPTCYTFPSAGGLLNLSFILFAGWYIGSDVPVTSYPTFILAGVPSMFGGNLITIPFLLNLMELPGDLLQVFISLDVITSRFATLLAVMHYATVGLIGTMAMQGLLRLRWLYLGRVALVSVLLMGSIIIGVHAFYTHVVVAPYTMDKALQRLDLLDVPQPSRVFAEVPATLEQEVSEPASLAQIEERGVLRVCFQPDEYPSAFHNTADPPELVGFDIEMAHRFARRMELPLEFLSTDNESTAVTFLNRGVCDIYMRTLPVTWRRTKTFGLTSPVYRSSLGLIVRDHRRNDFTTWAQIRAFEEPLRIAIEATPGNLLRGRAFFPEADLILLQNMEQQKRILESGGEGVDAIADMAEEGAAWTLLYPRFSLVVPKPAVLFPVSYAVARGNHNLLVALNAWLLAEKSQGEIDELYRYWMLGEAARVKKAPRWSVIRDVLGWVK